jgi:hypothetical protein
MAYTREVIQYVASQPGIDEFNLYYFFNTRTNGPDVAHVRITVSGSATTETPPSRSVLSKATVATDKAASSSAASTRSLAWGVVAGRYVNQMGNMIDVQQGVLFFTGIWNRERVSKKPFAILEHTSTSLKWRNTLALATTLPFSA